MRCDAVHNKYFISPSLSLFSFRLLEFICLYLKFKLIRGSSDSSKTYSNVTATTAIKWKDEQINREFVFFLVNQWKCIYLSALNTLHSNYHSCVWFGNASKEVNFRTCKSNISCNIFSMETYILISWIFLWLWAWNSFRSAIHLITSGHCLGLVFVNASKSSLLSIICLNSSTASRISCIFCSYANWWKNYNQCWLVDSSKFLRDQIRLTCIALSIFTVLKFNGNNGFRFKSESKTWKSWRFVSYKLGNRNI